MLCGGTSRRDSSHGLWKLATIYLLPADHLIYLVHRRLRLFARPCIKCFRERALENFHDTMRRSMVMDWGSFSGCPNEDQLFEDWSIDCHDALGMSSLINLANTVVQSSRLSILLLTRLHLPLPRSTRFLVYARLGSAQAEE
jgi:hypothetical protein